MEGCTPFSGDLGLSAKLLFADASCLRRDRNHPHDAAAWAAMLITGERSWLQSGLLAADPKHVLVCELEAIARGLEHYLEAGLLLPHDSLVILTDCQTAVDRLGGPPTAIGPRRPNIGVRDATERVTRLVAKAELFVTFAWVRGHQPTDTDDWRGLINSRVDRLARHKAKERVRELLDAAQEVQAA